MQDLGQYSNAIPTANSNLDDWITYMQGIHVSAIDMGLERVIPVFKQLNIQQTNAFVFTVAGTNGKGSTTATIAQICQQAGYKTALYQSPHLLEFNERVKINGVMVDDQTLIEAFVQVEQARVACNLTLSFFEMTTLAAFLIFAKAECDVWVLEIGLGGRLDVVNVITPNLAVITNVGVDHIEWLGDTREKIGIEKAGILRDDITLVFGEADMPTTIPPIIEQHHAKLIQFSQDYSFSQLDEQTWYYSSAGVTLALPVPNLSLHNTATAITAVLASPLLITQQHIANALPKINLAGRFDKRKLAQRQWVFDVAHNEHGMRFLLQQFIPFIKNYQSQYPNAQLHLVISMLADKEIEPVLEDLRQFSANVNRICTVHSGIIPHPRASGKERLTLLLSKYFEQVYIYDDLNQATHSAIEHSEVNDIILVCGSFYTISGVLTSEFLTESTIN